MLFIITSEYLELETTLPRKLRHESISTTGNVRQFAFPIVARSFLVAMFSFILARSPGNVSSWVCQILNIGRNYSSRPDKDA